MQIGGLYTADQEQGQKQAENRLGDGCNEGEQDGIFDKKKKVGSPQNGTEMLQTDKVLLRTITVPVGEGIIDAQQGGSNDK